WFSCFRKMGERDYRRQSELFEKHDLPLDVVVVDTDWHRDFWFGFDWNKRLFPDPDRFAAWLREKNLRAPFNVHPGALSRKDSGRAEFLRRSGAEERVFTEQDAPHWMFKGNQPIDHLDRRQADA